jgi:hypothetical protein
LYNAVFTQLRGTDNLGADKKNEECECLIGHFDAEDSDHGSVYRVEIINANSSL